MSQRRIAFFLSTLLTGGAERVILHVSGELARRGHPVDLLLVKKTGPLLAQVSPKVRIIELGTCSQTMVLPSLLRLPSQTRRQLLRVVVREKLPKVVRSLPLLVRYLQRVRPAALLATLPDNVLTALWAGWLAKGQRIVIREANTQSLNLEHGRHLFDRLFPAFAKEWYPEADGIIAVSDGVAEDIMRMTGMAHDRIATIHNPVDGARIAALAAAEPEDPWFAPSEPPVVIAVGRLDPQKDYPTLLRAFALARGRHPMRLVILGEGPEREDLAALARQLGIADDLRMPGLVANPYAYVARARVFALTSRWEGFPNVLVEALACGCPPVSTDCRSGPREILTDPRLGRLVAVGDATATADAITATLETPPPRELLLERASTFALDRVADAYLNLLLTETAHAGDAGARMA